MVLCKYLLHQYSSTAERKIVNGLIFFTVDVCIDGITWNIMKTSFSVNNVKNSDNEIAI